MSEWWTYHLSDFLLFSPRTYYRLIEQYNRDIWPLQLVAIGAGVLIFVLTLRGRGRVIITALLAILCLFVAYAFHLRRYSTINWAATWFAAAFAIEAILLLWMRPQKTSRLGLALFAFALLVQPFLGGRPLPQLEIFGIAPDPTVAATLGILLFHRARWFLWIIPLLWCAIAGATLWAMHAPDALALPVVAVVALAFRLRTTSSQTRTLP